MIDPNHDRLRLDRRSFVKAALVPAALAILDNSPARRPAEGAESPPEEAAAGPEIIDTNVHLFRWPFRGLKYDRTEALVQKLRRHRIAQAWAGSFEFVLHKQLDGANRRLADECRERGGGLLIPIGSVNPAWPDWEEDLRRCHEQYRMPGIRLYPAYHGYGLDHPELLRRLASAAGAGCSCRSSSGWRTSGCTTRASSRLWLTLRGCLRFWSRYRKPECNYSTPTPSCAAAAFAP